MDEISNRLSTRATKRRASQIQNKSAIPEHDAQKNHVIDWNSASIIDREHDRLCRQIKESIHIRRERANIMNRDEGAYQLHHIYDYVIASLTPSQQTDSLTKPVD